MNKLNCLEGLESNVELNGQYFTEEYSYIQIRLELCPYYNEKLGIQCLSATEIKQFFEEQSYIVSFALVKRIFTEGGKNDDNGRFTLNNTIDDSMWLKIDTNMN